MLILSVAGTSFSQTQEGSMFLGGGFTFSSMSLKEKEGNITRDIGRLSTVEFNPMAGYFIMDGIAVGLILDLQRQGLKYTDDDREVSHSVSIGPQGRFYTQLGPFFQGQVSLGGGAERFIADNGDEEKYPFRLVSWGMGIGYPYFLNENVALEPLLLFRAQNRTREVPGDEDETLKFRGLMLQIAFVYYLF